MHFGFLDHQIGFKVGMHNTGFFADIQYADTLQINWLIINTDTYTCIFFPHTYLQRSSSCFCSGIYIQYYYAYFYCVI